MLHWLYLLSYLGLCTLISFIFLNVGLLPMLIVAEVTLVVLYFAGLLIAGLFNIYYLIGFSFFILILGGLELILNILIILIL